MKIENPAFNYDRFGHDYSGYRQTDPRIAKYVEAALEDAQTILNVGAGAGSYEPADKYVVAVEPSQVMRQQRLAQQKVPAINARAEQLPFDNHAFDAVMASVTIHHWAKMEQGLRELKRVSRHKVVILTFDPAALKDFWNAAYFPELITIEETRFPSIESITQTLGGQCEVQEIPIPQNCVDGFQEAFYDRPEAFLDEHIRKAQSAWGFLPEGKEAELVKRLADDLASGEWERKYGHHRDLPRYIGSLRLIISQG